VVVAIHDVHTQRRERAGSRRRGASISRRLREQHGPMTSPTPMTESLRSNDAMCEMVGFTKEELLGCDSTPFTFPTTWVSREHPPATYLG